MSQYKDRLDEIAFSFSSLSQFAECPYAFALNKIENEKGDGNAHAEIGSYGHKIIERLLKKEVTKQDALIECVNEFENNVTYEISEAAYDRKYSALCSYIEDFDESIFDKYEILGVEKMLYWTIDNHRMVGVIDLILKDKKTEKIYLIDHKSAGHFFKKNGEPLKNMKDSYELYRKQMYLYADAMYQRLGYYPDYISWNHFLDGGKRSTIPFNKKDCEDAVKWASDIINQIYEAEEFPANYNYMKCEMFCNFRDTCMWKSFLKEEELWNEEGA